jgi:signal transduction histidine kinase
MSGDESEIERRRGPPAGFGSRVAHEIRGPLNLVAGALPEFAQSDADARAKLMELAQRGVAKLGRLADRLSLFSRIEIDSLQPERRPADLRELVETATARARNLVGRRRVTSTVSGASSAPIRGDVALLELAVQELVENALRHGRADVQVCVQCDNSTSRVDVVDDGRGVSPAEADVIFSAYGRDGLRGGLHIGLAMARSIARAHGGDVELVESRPGERTTFTLVLPSS